MFLQAFGWRETVLEELNLGAPLTHSLVLIYLMRSWTLNLAELETIVGFPLGVLGGLAYLVSFAHERGINCYG